MVTIAEQESHLREFPAQRVDNGNDVVSQLIISGLYRHEQRAPDRVTFLERDGDLGPQLRCMPVFRRQVLLDPPENLALHILWRRKKSVAAGAHGIERTGKQGAKDAARGRQQAPWAGRAIRPRNTRGGHEHSAERGGAQ